MTEEPDWVPVQVVTDELEAEQVRALLRTEGIESSYGPTEIGESIGGLSSGWTSQAILVAPEHADRARELLGAGIEEPGELE